MTDDERRLLLAVATCVLADLTANGPSVETQINVLRKLLQPFRDFMAEDMRRKFGRGQTS